MDLAIDYMYKLSNGNVRLLTMHTKRKITTSVIMPKYTIIHLTFYLSQETLLCGTQDGGTQIMVTLGLSKKLI